MLKRTTRLRREYIYRKSIEKRERVIQDKKQRLKRALDEDQRLSRDLRQDAVELDKALDWDDQGGEGIASHEDDEYKWAGVDDPKIVVTTSRAPSSKLQQFAKEIKLLFPNCQRLNRGTYEMKQLVDACRANDVTDIILLHEHRGNPDQLIVSHLPYGPTAYFNLSNCVMRHDIPDVGHMPQSFPHLIFNNLNSKLGARVTNILKYLFPVPKEDSRRVLTFSCEDDFISFRHHVYKMVEREVELTEIGPRFEMRLYQILLGTIEATDTADVEWVLRPYMNTSKKRKFLTDD